jgi:hypothetical protein
MRRKFLFLTILYGLPVCCLPVCGLAADRFTGFNNTTSTVFTGVFLAPEGTVKWGPNEALNDKDKIWDAGERLAIKNISRGRFDLKVVDRSGRACIKRGLDLTEDLTFEVRDEDLSSCKK